MAWVAVAGAGASLLGGIFSKKSEKKAAQTMNPYNVSGLFGGSATFDPRSNQANISASPQMRGMYGMLGQNAASMFGGGGNQDFLNFSQGLGNQQLSGLYDQYQGALGMMPEGAMQQYMSQMGQANGIANQDLQGLMDSRLSLLREQAAPREQEQMQSLQNTLFSQGRLGSTGGGMMMEKFARGLGEADLSRQLQAQQLGIQAQNQNLAQAGLLGELAGTGFANALNYNDIGVNRAGQRMQNAMGLFGFGQDLRSSMQQQGMQGLEGMLGIDRSLMDTAALGKNLAAGPQQAMMQSSSPMGGLFSGMGNSIMQGIDWSKMFSRSSGGGQDLGALISGGM
jgi:hypothetical protein